LADATHPNILVIWGDDIGTANLSCYSHGMMGYRTPNIDRLAAEGMMFTDHYGEQRDDQARGTHASAPDVLNEALRRPRVTGPVR